MTSSLVRLQNWYKNNCNGDWEHSYGINIGTLDNPGWKITIDLEETDLEKLIFNLDFQDNMNEDNWFQIKIENAIFDAACGPENLEQTLNLFLDEIVNRKD
jgi:hypothetical protein